MSDLLFEAIQEKTRLKGLAKRLIHAHRDRPSINAAWLAKQMQAEMPRIHLTAAGCEFLAEEVLREMFAPGRMATEDANMSTETAETFTTGDPAQGIVEKPLADMTGDEAATALLLHRRIAEHWEHVLDQESSAYRRGRGTKYDLPKLQDHAETIRDKLDRLTAQMAERLPEPEDGALISAAWIIEVLAQPEDRQHEAMFDAVFYDGGEVFALRILTEIAENRLGMNRWRAIKSARRAEAAKAGPVIRPPRFTG